MPDRKAAQRMSYIQNLHNRIRELEGICSAANLGPTTSQSNRRSSASVLQRRPDNAELIPRNSTEPERLSGQNDPSSLRRQVRSPLDSVNPSIGPHVPEECNITSHPNQSAQSRTDVTHLSSRSEPESNVTGMGAISTIESDEKIESPETEYYGTSSTVSFMRMAHESIKRHSTGGGRPVNFPLNRRNQQESIATIIHDASRSTGFALEDFALPPRSLADHLLECFLERMFCLYPFFHWQSFYEAYENLWVPNKQPVHRLTKLNIGLGSIWDSGPQSLVFYISLNGMFAIGCQFADIPETRRQELGFTFFMRAKQHIAFDISAFLSGDMVLNWNDSNLAPDDLGFLGRLMLWANDLLSERSHNNWVEDSSWDWRKEIVVVTGGSGGIGGSLVQLLAKDGVCTVVLDIIKPTYSTDTLPVTYYRCDLSDPTDIRKVCERIRKEVGHPTVLVNNAGLSRGETIAEGSYHDNKITLDTNLAAPFLLTKEFLPYMIQCNHGHIFNISSMSAYLPPAGLADYGASKAGLVAMHEALGLELKFRHNAPGVRTSLAVLSFTKTPLFKGETNQIHFLFPLLDVETVAEEILNTLYSGRGRTIFLPGILRYLSGLRGVPEWVQNFVRSQTQVLKVDFKGRQKVDPVTGRLSQA
ncbi:short chain dehydrogenase/reductase family protein [Paecilomyces variotii No. 5]|uniref:Short chain dehydrogenase/reductase family protein n=1 Tax=Byssochlamys spectabilis (strain No. 5 / NBRC 109023) TaxID=1356009 RepID=V5FKH6_BYSSN|nr:short chain dehydrogenase/reductase family protein [Paecilomyces variotii No. 5]